MMAKEQKDLIYFCVNVLNVELTQWQKELAFALLKEGKG